MKAEEYYQTNYRAVHNTMFKENQKIKQFDFNDMVDFATQFSQSQNKELIEQLEKERFRSEELKEHLIKCYNAKMNDSYCLPEPWRRNINNYLTQNQSNDGNK